MHRRLENPVLRIAREEHARPDFGYGAGGIVALFGRQPLALVDIVGLIVPEIHVAGHGVEVIHRVAHPTTADAVLRLRLHIVEVGIHRQAIEELVVLTEGEGVAVVLIVLEHTVGMRVGIADVASHLLRTSGEAYAVVRRHAEIEEVGNIVGTIVAQIDVAREVDAHLRENLRSRQV